jgi:hypothetical protein
MCSGPFIAAEAYYFLLDEKVTKNQAGKIAPPHRPLGLGPGFPAGPRHFLIMVWDLNYDLTIE